MQAWWPRWISIDWEFAHNSAVVSLGAQFAVFLWWMHRRIGDDEIQRAFIRDLALRHLPAVYLALQMMAEQQGITLGETPIVNFVDLTYGPRRL